MTVGVDGSGSHAKSKSPVQIFGNVFISFIGAGVLGLPYAFKEAGFLEGIIIMALVAFLSTKAMLMLISCKDRVSYKVNNGEAMHEVWPPPPSSSSSPFSPSIAGAGHDNYGGGFEDVIDNPHQSLLATEASSNCSLSSTSSSIDRLIGYKGNKNDEFKLKTIRKPPKKVSYYESYHHMKNRDLEYADVAEFTLGYSGKLAVEISLVVSQTGFCCAYLIFIQENLTDFVPGVRQASWLPGLLPLLAALCFYRNLSSLSLFSILADLANVFAYVIVFYFDFSQHHNVSKHPKAMTLKGLPFFLGIALYCYEGAGMILSLEASVDPSVRYLFKRIFKAVMFVVTTLYIAFGSAGYLSFGKDTEPIITLNLPDSIFPHLVKACLCFSLFFTYPMMMFPVVKLLESKFLPAQLPSSSNRSSSPPPSSSSSSTQGASCNTNSNGTWSSLISSLLLYCNRGSTGRRRSSLFNNDNKYLPGNILRCFLVGLTGIIVVAIPNFSVIMALVGSLCCTLLAFVLPALFHLYLFEEEEVSQMDLIIDYVLIFIGVFGALLGTWDALCRLFPSLSIFAVYTSAKSTLLSFIH